MKKGFTLIELLAVIIILGLVAGITIPIVTNTTNNAKEQASFISIENHIKNINAQLSASLLEDDEEDINGTYEFNSLNVEDYPEDDTIRCTSYMIIK